MASTTQPQQGGAVAGPAAPSHLLEPERSLITEQDDAPLLGKLLSLFNNRSFKTRHGLGSVLSALKLTQPSLFLAESTQHSVLPQSNEVAPTFLRRTTNAFATLWRTLAWRSAETNEELRGNDTAFSSVSVLTERSNSRGTLDIERSSEIEGATTSSAARSSSAIPVCLICLENLAPDDFASGRAISLGCQCRGDLALRHRDCAVKWAQVKDDGRGGVPVCELCKHPVRNLPPIPPRPRLPVDPESAAAAAAASDVYSDPSAYANFAPSTADLVFDCIRVTWVAMIVSILFFEASLGSALWTGVVAGVAYSLMVRIMYRQHFEAMRAYAQQHAAARQQLDPSGGQVPVHVV